MNEEERKKLFNNITDKQKWFLNVQLNTKLWEKVDDALSAEEKQVFLKERIVFNSDAYISGELLRCKKGLSDWVEPHVYFETLTQLGAIHSLDSMAEMTINDITLTVFKLGVFRNSPERALFLSLVFLKGKKIGEGYFKSMYTAKSPEAIIKKAEALREFYRLRSADDDDEEEKEDDKEEEDDTNMDAAYKKQKYVDEFDNAFKPHMPDLHEYKLLHGYYHVDSWPSDTFVCHYSF